MNIKRTDGINAIDSTELSPIAARNSGDNKPIDKLLMKENAAMVEIFPPKIPVITGRSCCRGKTQIMAACANVVLNLKNNK